MEIIERIEPQASSIRLLEYERKYGYDSRHFYNYYQLGICLLNDQYEAADWAFEYEVNLATKEEFDSSQSERVQARGEKPPGFCFVPMGRGYYGVLPRKIRTIGNRFTGSHRLKRHQIRKDYTS